MSENQPSIWSYPNLLRNINILADEIGILPSATSPDSETLATCATDENLTFWMLYEMCTGSLGSTGEGSNMTGKGNKMAEQMTIQ